jgi:trk system potassium uptake protein TrkH
MHRRSISNILFVVLTLMGVALVPAAAVALWDGTSDGLALVASAGLMGLVGVFGYFLTRERREGGRRLSIRDAYLIGAMGWITAGLAGAIPFLLFAHMQSVWPEWVSEVPPGTRLCALPEDVLHPGREFCSVSNAVFESVSGITTTGASVIRVGLWDDLSSTLSQGKPGLPRGLLLWRSVIQWLGGMGILVLAVTLLSLAGVGGLQLLKTEMPGPTPGKLKPRIADTARILWKLYLVISVAQVVFLMIGGMDAYNAVSHTFTTMATGGFSTLATSVAGMQSAYFEWIITFFMLLAGANFTLHYLAVFRGSFEYLRNAEFRVYVGLTASVILLTCGFLWLKGPHDGMMATFRSASFQTVSILTTTGFATRDFGLWPPVLQFVLLGLMFVGGCSGSTGGGMKVIRVQVVALAAYRELTRIIHPRSVSAVRVGHRVVEEAKVQAMVGVVIFFCTAFVLSSALLASLGLDIVTSISAVAACLGNVGPGLGDVGPSLHFFDVPLPGKWILVFNMLAGRLEIYTIVILFSPQFWRK